MRINYRSEKGQAIVLIAFAIVGMFALVALALDGGQAFSDRRQAQNAADTAAMAAALTYQLENGSTAHIRARVLDSTTSNGYPDSLPRSSVAIDPNGTAVVGECPDITNGKDFRVTIQSNINTWFAGILGIRQMHNTVSAVARGCEFHWKGLFEGNAVVSLAPVGTSGFNAGGTGTWNVACDDGTPSGGIFANGDAYGGGTSNTTAPSLTVVGTGGDMFVGQPIGEILKGTPLAFPGDIISKMPRIPKCDGTAYLDPGDGAYHPEAGKDGSVIPVALNGGQNYAAGLYCVTKDNANWNSGTLYGRDVTFYIDNATYDLKFAGSGTNGEGFDITAPMVSSNEYRGYAIILPLTCKGATAHAKDIVCDLEKLKAGLQTIAVCDGSSDTPRMDMRGNGDTGIFGTVLAPTACISMLGNSLTENHGQIIGYTVDASGSAEVNVCYKADEHPQEPVPPSVQLLK
ncbi:MAG: Tad domain-containing protein [Chloroflexi bacterium]|nr:Tad domain-containing protein [Chloroflexota bacterium]